MNKFFIVATLFLMAFGVQAVCLTELDGEIYGCERITSGDKWCKSKYGKDSVAFRTTNTCSEELSYELRGKTFKPSKNEQNAKVEAACMTFEQGEKLGCQYYDFFKAENYCAENFGHRYLPFVITKTCSLAKASALRGEISSAKLLDGVRSQMDEIDSLITMVDKSDPKGLTAFTANRPTLSGEFYTNSMKAIMAKMNMVKGTLEKNSQLNIVMKRDKYVEEFLKQTLRYLSFMARIHKLYAYVAHQNHYVLKTYTYTNLDYLNLKLKKDWGLELLSKANFEVKTVDGGKNIEFAIGEQEKQTYEYMAMQDPRDITDYAKAVTFLGVRENLTNLWAVQRLTARNIPNDAVRSCGKDFLSFRPDANGRMENSVAMKDLWNYDVFYNDYVQRWNGLVDASRTQSLLGKNATQFMYETLTQVKGLKSFLMAQESVNGNSDIKALATSDSAILVSSENEAWDQFSNDHFPTIVLPGDNIQDKAKVIERITEEAFNKRVDAISHAFVGIYVWLEDATLRDLEKTVKSKLANYKADFKTRMNTSLSKAMEGYASKTRLAGSNRTQKVSETVEIASSAAHAAYLMKRLDVKKPTLQGLPILDPNGPEEMMMLFQNSLNGGFYDLKEALETNKEYAALAQEFFEEISKKFFEKTVDKKSMQFKVSDVQKRKILRQVAFEVVKKYQGKYPVSIANLIRQEYPNHVIAVQDNVRVVRPHVLPVFTDNKPVTTSNSSLLESLRGNTTPTPLRDEYRVAVDNTRVVLGYQPLFKDPALNAKKPVANNNRNNPDKVTTGEINKPMVVTDKGEIKSGSAIVGQYNQELLSLYKNSSILSKKAKNAIDKNKSKMVSFERFSLSSDKKIGSKNEFMSRIFKALNFNFVTVSSEYMESHFVKDVPTQMILVNNYVGQAYQTAPLLRNDFKWTQKVKEMYYNYKLDRHFEQEVTKSYTEPLLVKIALDAFNTKTMAIDKKKVEGLVSEAISVSEKNVASKLSKFCSANYMNHKNDNNFKDIFKASGFLRATMKDPTGVDQAVHKKILKFDEQIAKDSRSRWQAMNEDYLEPTLHILGAIAIISVAIVAILGTGGTAAPGVIGLTTAGLSMFLSIEFFVSFPLVVGSLYARMNTHFIEVPAQLKFQKSLALSQVDSAKVVDWDMLKAEEKENKSNKIWTIGLMPLDFIYGAAIVKHVRSATGIKAVNAYRRQTGMALRKFSAPPKSMLIKRSFKDLREKHGVWKAVQGKTQDMINNVRMVQPRYTALPQEMIEGVPLRMGLSRKAQELGLANKPWDLLEDMVNYRSQLKQRVTIFETFSKEQGKLIQEVRHTGSLKLKEAMQFGVQYTKAGFLPKSLREAYSNGKLVDFFKNYDNVLDNLNKVQGELIQGRVESIGNVVDKMMDFKRVKTLNGATPSANANMMDEFLGLLSTQEIMAMEEMAKWSKGSMSSFKQVFSDYKTIVQGLRPHTYLYGHVGAEMNRTMYPANVLMGEDVNPSYAFKNNEEDLVNFYESMMKQNGFTGNKYDEMRREIENELSRHFQVTSEGKAF